MVFSFTGKGRAAAIVIGYLMTREKHSFLKAEDLVRYQIGNRKLQIPESKQNHTKNNLIIFLKEWEDQIKTAGKIIRGARKSTIMLAFQLQSKTDTTQKSQTMTNFFK